VALILPFLEVEGHMAFFLFVLLVGLAIEFGTDLMSGYRPDWNPHNRARGDAEWIPERRGIRADRRRGRGQLQRRCRDVRREPARSTGRPRPTPAARSASRATS
jgi:hypothetical protein